jgi:hypothetical protein
MKKIIQLLLLLISLNCFTQTKATILKTNGEVLKGFAYVSSYDSNIIKFKKNINDKPKKFGHKDIKKVFFILGDESFIEYQFKKISKRKFQLMKVLIKGKLNLYSFTDSVLYNTQSSGEGFGNVSIGKLHTSTHFYLSKNEYGIVDEFPNKSVFKSFKKNASTYFNDCNELVKKINNREFKNSNVIEVVEFYNSTCGKNGLN